MARNIQEYINGLVNKKTIFYLDLNNKEKELEGEITNLKEFSNLRGISTSNNQFSNLDFLNTLPNKDKLKSLNLFGNQIKEVDFTVLFAEFPNLEKINLTGNPSSAKNLDKLTNEQFGKLVNGIKEQKIKVNSFKGTILMDLLTYAQQLANQGRPEYNAHIQTLTQINQPVQPNQGKKTGNGNTPLLIGGLVILGVVILAIGYYLGKKRKSQELEI